MGEWVEDLRDLLVVDDNPADARFIEEALQQSELNPNVHHVTTSREAQNFLTQHPPYHDVPLPDLVLLDWHLTETTGEKVLPTLRGQQVDVPVIVMTSAPTKQGADDSAMAKADTVIEKPTNPDGYIEAIRSISDD